MKRFILLSVAIFICLALACKKEDSKLGPSIKFKQSTGYVWSDATLNTDSSIRVGVIANLNGDDKLAKFEAYQNGVLSIEEQLSQHEYLSEFMLIKSAADYDSISFVVIDAKGNSAAISLRMNLKQK